jgi:putative endonuclease
MSTSGRFFVYILASRKYGTIYAGVTGDLPVRVYVHREALIPGFSSRYKTYRLVYFEQHDSAYEAIAREKRIKKWRRAWKIELIEKSNPDWNDLYDSLFT